MTRRPRKPTAEAPPRRATIPLPVPMGTEAMVGDDRTVTGYRRVGQRGGRPASLMPLEAHLRKLSTDFLKQQQDNERAVAKAIGALDPLRAAAGKASGLARQGNIERIKAEEQRLLESGTASKDVAAKVEKVVGVSARHVRRHKKKRT